MVFFVLDADMKLWIWQVGTRGFEWKIRDGIDAYQHHGMILGFLAIDTIVEVNAQWELLLVVDCRRSDQVVVAAIYSKKQQEQ